MHLSNTDLIFIGSMLFVAGVLTRQYEQSLEQIIENQQAVLYDVATDNMALRFHIHNTEVEANGNRSTTSDS